MRWQEIERLMVTTLGTRKKMENIAQKLVNIIQDLQVFYQLSVPWATKVQEFFVHELEPHPSLMTLGNIG